MMGKPLAPALMVGLLLLGPFSQARAQDAAAPAYPGAGYPAPYLSGPAISTAQASKLRTLEADLSVLADLTSGRVLDGSLSIVAGSAFVTVAVFLDDALVQALLGVTGGLAIGRGVIALSLVPDAGSSAASYQQMPMLDAGQVSARIAYGEQALTSLARRTRRARLVDGALSMTAGAAYVPTYLLLRGRDEPDYRFGRDAADYVGLGVAAISFVAGLVSVLRKSEAEKRVAAYTRMRDELEAQAHARFEPRLSLQLTAERAAISLLTSF
jgi:hypothetical protein